MPSDQTTRIPHVPVRHPMFDEEGRLTRAWIIFFERLWQPPAAGGGGEVEPFDIEDLYWRTLLLKDTTVGDDIADHVDAQETGVAVKFVGLLRKTITSNLTVRVKKGGVTFCTLTIPSSTGVDTLVQTTSFSPSTAVTQGNVFSWDVTASDGQTDAAGVASFTLYMKKTTTITP